MNTQQPQWGFTSPDGFYQPLHLLTTQSLEYAGRSLAELEELMRENIALEKYEVCALIRDEISKRISAQ
jgi:hypothetical protein